MLIIVSIVELFFITVVMNATLELGILIYYLIKILLAIRTVYFAIYILFTHFIFNHYLFYKRERERI